MSYISLPTIPKKETKKLNNFSGAYAGKFNQDLANNVGSATTSDFYSRIANDFDVPSEGIQKYLLPTSGFAKGVQTDINHYVMGDRLNNASFRQKLGPLAKKIFRRQNPRASV